MEGEKERKGSYSNGNKNKRKALYKTWKYNFEGMGEGGGGC